MVVAYRDVQVSSLKSQLLASMPVSRILPPLLLLLLVRRAFSNSSDYFEDITGDSTYGPRGNNSPRITVTRAFGTIDENPMKAKNQNILHNYLEKKKENYKNNPANNTQQQKRSEKSGLSSVAPYDEPKLRNKTAKISQKYDKSRQVIAGIPDMEDRCFRRYVNCIVVNAQPYERRSSLSLLQCKQHCLHSQIGVYSCRSFVYDNINQVCDLFTHLGDQAPARLLKFQFRDYFEPTYALKCLTVAETTISTTTTTTIPITTTTYYYKETTERTPLALASKVDRREESGDIPNTSIVKKQTEPKEFDVPNTEVMRCQPGKKISFLRTEGFHLFNNDDIIMQVADVSECVLACEKNEIAGQPLDCRSFDFFSSTCNFSSETAVPVGNGQLQQYNESVYYEKICVPEFWARTCPPTFTRFPQMVLVGFAQAVVDTTTFEACFEHCIDSYGTFGFNCTSGMYFFEEAQLNCILNSENRHTQGDLFTEENSDIVDYFEIGCDRPVTNRRHRVHAAKTFPPLEKLVIAPETQTEWSKCEDGLQHRRRDCNSRENCGLESRPCDQEIKSSPIQRDSEGDLPTREDIARVKAEIRKNGLHCAPDACCAVFANCSVGLRLSSKRKRLEWCKRSCHDSIRKQIPI